MVMRVIQIPVLQDNYQYLLICEKTGEAAAIDAPDAPAVAKVARQEGVKLVAVWNTHHHWDHIGANEELVSRFDVPVYCSAYDFEQGRVPCAKQALHEGDEVRVGNLVFRILEIPGHTLGHIAYVGEGVVFCGDTLFAGGCGRLFEGTPAQMQNSLSKLMALPDETLVYCMHEYTEKNLDFALTLEPENEDLKRKRREVLVKRQKGKSTVPTTLAEEKSYHPFLRTGKPSLTATLTQLGLSSNADAVETFRLIRELKDQF
jgi:hydroxyacylglutathione hydrolase